MVEPPVLLDVVLDVLLEAEDPALPANVATSCVIDSATADFNTNVALPKPTPKSAIIRAYSTDVAPRRSRRNALKIFMLGPFGKPFQQTGISII